MEKDNCFRRVMRQYRPCTPARPVPTDADNYSCLPARSSVRYMSFYPVCPAAPRSAVRAEQRQAVVVVVVLLQSQACCSSSSVLHVVQCISIVSSGITEVKGTLVKIN